MAFTGVGGVVQSSVGGVLISSIGWSNTYLVFAALSVLTIPVTLLMVRSRPEDLGLEPVGFDVAAKHDAVSSEDGVSAAQAYKMPVFFLLCAMCFFLNIGMYVYFMIPSYASTLAIGAALPLLGATASSVAMAGQTISKLALGAVGEKRPQSATIVTLVLGIAGVALFALFPESAPSYYVAALAFGFYYGITNVMMPQLTRRAFGNRDYAPIYSKVSMVEASPTPPPRSSGAPPSMRRAATCPCSPVSSSS